MTIHLQDGGYSNVLTIHVRYLKSELKMWEGRVQRRKLLSHYKDGRRLYREAKKELRSITDMLEYTSLKMNLLNEKLLVYQVTNDNGRHVDDERRSNRFYP